MKKNKESEKIESYHSTKTKPQFNLSNQFSFKPLKTERKIRPSVSFNDEIIKIFNVKNIQEERKSFENKYKNKIDNSFNDIAIKNEEDFVHKCEIQIYKIDKPFFLRPCMSFKIEKNSEWDIPKIRIKRQRKKLVPEPLVVKSIDEKIKKSFKNFDTSNEMFNDLKNLKTNSILKNGQENQKPILSNLFNYLKLNKKNEIKRRWISKIPIRVGSNLVRRANDLDDRFESKKKFKFGFDSKKYDAIFEKMQQNDRENRFYYLRYLLNQEKSNSEEVIVNENFKIFIFIDLSYKKNSSFLHIL